MALKGESALVVQRHREKLDEIAKQLVEALYGPDGMPWGTKFAELEDDAYEIGQALSRRLIGLSLEAQAGEELPLALERCPDCDQPLAPEEEEGRVMTTRSGEVAWCEPQSTCRTCRRAFFPSVQGVGDRPGALQSGDVTEDCVRRSEGVVSRSQPLPGGDGRPGD
jgi:hypothetical protein